MCSIVVQITAGSGVSPSSILGLLFFLIFINDITAELQFKTLLYADDIKLFSSKNSIQGRQLLQDDLII